MLLLSKFLIKYKFYHLCKKAGNSILNFDMPDSQIPGHFLQRDFLHICASLYAWNWEQTRNVHKQHKSYVMGGHSAATTKLHSSPGLPLTLYGTTPNTHPQPLLPFTPTHRFLYFLGQAQPPGLVGTGTGRPGGTGHLVLKERQGGWTKRKGPNFLLRCNWASAHTIIAYCIMTHA